jgi:hypothetical protein
MRRRTFDALVSTAGLVLAAVLLVAGVLLTWGHSYANNQVTSQLSAQKIVFPTTTNPEFKALPKADQAAMAPYAGQLMTNGAQAETYADHFIKVHLNEIGKGQTYSQVSAASMADPTNAALAGEVQTLFRGSTLRGLLLNSYGWWQIGQYALYAAIGLTVAALVVFGAFAFELVSWRVAVRKEQPARVAVPALGTETA